MLNPPLLHRLDKALKNHPHLNRQHVFLESERGQVIVRGTVKSWFQKQMIQEAIRKVEGNAEIRNLIEVQ